ncbi:protein kinase [Streptomyces sp. NPDC014806]|uniref:serine/threonine-protein kinase n=1 Tax=Streptomyces sp. NPDC014806 TaxID=3364920 RepID=UPI003703022F
MGADVVGERLRAEDPREIAGYRLYARIGEGGMGTVYLSRTRGGQPVALKVIRRDFGGDPGFRRRFEQEVQAARRVQGYHVVPVVDHDTTGERPWLASAFVPGLPLHEALAAHGPLPLPAVFTLVGCTARALISIHSAGIVHRDLKPSNILLSNQGPYVIDFGIARAADATQLTVSGGVIGTPQFMSPEHALGETVGPATDVFSLGLIAAVAATGRHPYGDGGALTLAAQIANTALRPPRLDAYDERLRPLLERCLAAAPAARIGTEELAALCEQAAGRPLNDFTGWLPEPLAADLAARERAALTPPPEPTVTDQGARGPHGAQGTGPVPPHGPEAPGPVPPHGPEAPGPVPPHGPTFAGAPTTAPPPPTYSPAAPRRDRTGLVVAGAAVALVVAVTVTWTLARSGGTAHGAREQPTHSATPTGPGPTSPAPTDTPSQESAYTAVFTDRTFALRSPGAAAVVEADLDIPKVHGTSDITSGNEIELDEVAGGHWSFKTPWGKSAGTTPEQCLEGARGDVLPTQIDAKDLRATIPAGTVLCTETDEGNLAMLKVTGITASAGNLPDYATKLTLWKQR